MHATNFSNGVAALAVVLQFATPLLTKLSYRAAITETHHVHKLDAPSGTANTISEIVKKNGGTVTDIHSIREGEIIGKHDVVFSGSTDEIVIGHAASSRHLFARGAIDAALWLCSQDQQSGIFTMDSYFRTRFGL
jgi:4-hydroxy-tetrahydrodipicolinate reductase